jgi:hypothetical protein
MPETPMNPRIRAPRSRITVALFAAIAVSAVACNHPIEPRAEIVDVTGDYDAVMLNGRRPPVVYDSSSSGWNAVAAVHLVMRADRAWWIVRTDRHMRKGISTDSTFEVARGTWNNSAGGPALLVTPGIEGSTKAELRGEVLTLTEECRSFQECWAVGNTTAVFLRSR